MQSTSTDKTSAARQPRVEEYPITKKVFFEPLWNIKGALRAIIDFPPGGYEFVLVRQLEDGLPYNVAIRWPVTHRLSQLAGTIVPYLLAMAWLQRWRRPPEGTALTYGLGHIVFRREPWVVEVEYASHLVGPHLQQFKRFRPILERALASSHCRKIVCWSEAGRRTMVEGLKSEKFQHKVELVHYAAPSKPFVKDYEAKKNIKLLFVGSQSPSRPFEIYGGVELLEAFALLRQKYNNVELVVRATLSADCKARYGGMEGLRILEQVVPWETLEREFQSADICALPYHTTTPHTILDAMSYELPVVGRNTWANPEYIQDGVTGLLVQPSAKVPYYWEDTCHPNFPAAEFREAIREPAPEVVDELAQKLGLLIENPELRRRLGKAARWEVEQGKFSIRTRQEKLRRVFDEAIASDD